MAVSAVVGELFANAGSHDSLNALFQAVGAPGSPPDGAHDIKWKTWLIRTANDPAVDALDVFGQLLSEPMDLPPNDPKSIASWEERRSRVVQVLEENGLRYYRGGRLLPKAEATFESKVSGESAATFDPPKPSSIEDLIATLAKGLPRAMHPLTQRRKGSPRLNFDTEYDIQDLLHALLRPWVRDIRPEECTPSYAGSSTRMDFLLPEYKLVLELKLVRDNAHGRNVGKELI